jgi:TP901 family phage tail tape measure protein
VADRSVTVRVRAETTQYQSAMGRAEKSTDGLTRAARKAEREHKKAMDTLGKGAVVAGGAMLLGFGKAAAASMSFEKAMSGVAAATMGTTAEMRQLSEAALKAGADTVFSATEAAAGQTALAKAGVSTANILGGALTGALDLAAAGELDVGRAAEIAATSMTQFGLAGKDVPHIADVLAAAAGKAQGSVQDMSLALGYVGPVAAQMSVSLEETAGTIALLAEQGILGEQAGTGLRGMLSSLTSPSAQVREEMEKLGISVYDAGGQFVGFEGVAGQLQSRMAGLTNAERDEAFGRIFGNAQITAARVLYAGGADAVRKWTDEVNDSGYASRQAAIKLDNLAGDLEALGGSIETALIKSGSSANGVLREMAQTATGVVNAYSDAPPVIQGTVTAFLGLGGAVALVGGGMLLLIPRIAATRAAMTALGLSAKGTMAFLGGPWGLALTAATVGLTIWAKESANARARVEELTGAIEADSGALGDNTRATVVNRLEKDGWLKQAQKLGIESDRLVDAVLGEAGAYDEVRAAIEQHPDVMERRLRGARTVNDQLLGMLGAEQGAVGDAAEAHRRKTEALAAGAGAEAEAVGGLNNYKTAVQEVTTATKEYEGALRDLFDVMLNSDAAASAAEEAIDELAAAVKSANKNGKEFHFVIDKSTGRLADNTKAQRAAGDQVRENVRTILDEAVAMREEGRSVEDTTRATKGRIAALVRSLNMTGLNKDEVARLIRQYKLTPKEVETLIKASGAKDAEKDVRELKYALDRLHDKVITVRVNQHTSYTTDFTGHGRRPKKKSHSGEFITGTEEVDRTLLGGEGVLSRRGMARIGGAAALNAINSGATLTPTSSAGGMTSPMAAPVTVDIDYDRLARAVTRMQVRAYISEREVGQAADHWMGRQ